MAGQKITMAFAADLADSIAGNYGWARRFNALYSKREALALDLGDLFREIGGVSMRDVDMDDAIKKVIEKLDGRG